MNAAWIKYLPGFIRAQLESRRGFQAIIANSGWLLFDKILRMGGGLLVSVWIARYLGPEQFGVWNYALAVTALFAAFANLGLDSIVVRELVKHPEQQNELLSSAFGLKLIGGVLALLTAIGTISFARSGDSLTLWLVAISATGFIFQSANVIDFYFQAKVRSKFTVYAASSAFALIAMLKIILIIKDAPLLAFAWAGLAEIALTALFLIAVFRAKNQSILPRGFRWSVAKRLLTDSWPLILSSMAIIIYMRIDQIMIGQMLGNAEVGLFSAAVRISEIWYVIPWVIVNSVGPSMIETRKLDEVLYLQRIQKLYVFMVAISLLIAVPMTFLSDWVMVTAFGESFLKAGGVLAIHIWGGLFVFLGVASGHWLVAENLQKLAFYRTLAGAVLNVIANFFLIPLSGLLGAAIATVLAQATAAYFFDITSIKSRKMFWMKTKALLFIFYYGKWR